VQNNTPELQSRSEVNTSEEEVYRFILNQIDSVPQMEALLLLWENRPKQWSENEIAARLYVGVDTVRNIMQELLRRRLVAASTESPKRFWYETRPGDGDSLIEAVAATYRRDLVRVSTFIHTKASSAVRDFADAFKFKKDRD
jgi:predicted ArsR family transcriptional regulator